MIVYGEGLREWLEQRIGAKILPGSQFLGRVKDSVPVAVVGFTGYTNDDVEIDFAAEPGGISRQLMNATWTYVFRVLNCVRCSAQVRDDNFSSLDLVERFGFVHEGTKRKAKDGHDVLIFGLLREDYDQRNVQLGLKRRTKASHTD